MSVAVCSGLGFRYSGAPNEAIADIDLELEAGEIVLIEGASGSGKSTLLRALAGLVPRLHGGRFRGRCVVGGLDTREAAPQAVAARAALAFQDPEAQGVMRTVEHDVAFGPECLGRPAARVAADAAWALSAAGAEHLRERPLDELSTGERQRAALAAVLALRSPIVLLDEPTAQLDGAATAALAETLSSLAREGVCIVVAEHRVERLVPIADRRLSMIDGRLVADTDAADPVAPVPPPAEGPVALRAERLAAARGARTVLADVDLELRAGSVTALTGANGAGKTTLLRALAGLDRPAAGRVLLGGDDVTVAPIEARFPRLALVTQDPGRHLLCERVRDEVAFALEQLGVPRPERERRVAETLAWAGLAALAERHPLDLSVGERERVAIAAIAVARPRVLLLDEPTRGMDPRRRSWLAASLLDLARDGVAVLVATHDLGFARACAHRELQVAGGRLLEPGAEPRVATAAGR
jgi:energy-coupling factor transport system ATP-binding protein